MSHVFRFNTKVSKVGLHLTVKRKVNAKQSQTRPHINHSLVWFGQVQRAHTKEVGDFWMMVTSLQLWAEQKQKGHLLYQFPHYWLTQSATNPHREYSGRIKVWETRTERSTQPTDPRLKNNNNKKKKHCRISKFKLWNIWHKVTVLNEFCVLDLCWRFSLNVFFLTSLLKEILQVQCLFTPQ